MKVELVREPIESEVPIENQYIISKKYVDNEIGNEYKTWTDRQIVFITSPTGSGKTHFILYTLLSYIIEQKGRLLYLVNRKVLKMQLEEELKNKVEWEMRNRFDNVSLKIEDYIRVMTYQSIEKSIKSNSSKDIIEFLKLFNWVVYDECHYFYMDSDFNTNTEVSYDCLRREFIGKRQIFMSATMDKIKKFILNRKPTLLPRLESGLETVMHMASVKEYTIPFNYDYINLHVLKNIDHLIEHIEASNGSSGMKWLIFVDKKDLGLELKERLISQQTKTQNNDIEDMGKNTLCDKDVVFVDADYAKDQQAENAVNNITRQSYSNEKIIISTSVMDNGISFQDRDLRNIVICADTQETFIQMLGRKRKDGENVQLYIFKRNVEYFKKRKNNVKRILKFYNEYVIDLDKIYSRKINQNYDTIKLNPYTILYHTLYQMGFDIPVNYSSGRYPLQQPAFFDIRNYIEYEKALHVQSSVMDKIFSDESSFRYVNKICYILRGFLAVNHFSITKHYDVEKFYEEMEEKMEYDEDFFVRVQASWLGISKEKIEKIIKKSNENIYERSRRILNESIEEIVSRDLTGKEINEWKKKNMNFLIFFLEKDAEYKENEKKDIKKSDRVSIKRFNRIMKQAGLSYKLEKTMEDKNGVVYWKIVRFFNS